MSHSTCFVVVQTLDSLEKMKMVAEVMLAPFNEEIQVKTYLKDCYCVGMTAFKEARDEVEKTYGTIETYRQKFSAQAMEKFGPTDKDHDAFMEYMLSDQSDKDWRELIKDYSAALEAAEKAHPLYQKPDPDCEECKGSGKMPTTYNPRSKWDWYALGGRWDGIFNGQNVAPTSDWANASSPEELADMVMPFALLEPDGTWHEKGDMGWWGMVKDEKEKVDWNIEVASVMGKYAQGYSVLCYDLHI